MFVNFNILNQLGSPAINSNTFANRPVAGQTGRLFVSTDTYEIYRDNGTTWDLIGGPGSSTITGSGTATQVAYFTSSQAIGSSANLFWDNTNTRLGVGTATPGAALDIHSTGIIAQFNTTNATGNVNIALQRSGTGVWRIGDTYNGGVNFFELHNTATAINAVQITAAHNKSSWQASESYTSGIARANYFDYNLNVSAGGNFSSPNAITALGASLDLTLAGSATIPSGARSGLDAYNSIGFTGTGTLTQGQGTQIRAYSNLTAGWAFNGSATGTITHLAGLRALFPDNTGAAIAVTNNYALLLNDQTANTGTVTYTNRWGVYQEGASDLNYFGATTLIGTTVNAGYKLDVFGPVRVYNGDLKVESSSTRALIYLDTPAAEFQLDLENTSGTGVPFFGLWNNNPAIPLYNYSITVDYNTNNVGIGYLHSGSAQTPQYSLDVNGSAKATNLLVKEQTAPGTPASGLGILYAKTDNQLYYKNDAGTEYNLTTPTTSASENLTTVAFQALGSTFKGMMPQNPSFVCTTTSIMSNSTLLISLYYLPTAQTITGVKWAQTITGVYTANNYNGVALYSYSGGTCTLVASSTNDGTIWSTGSAVWRSKAFSSTYSASAGIYFVAFLYNQSAQTTAPTLAAGASTSSNSGLVDFTNSAKVSSTLSAQTSLPLSFAMSSTNNQTVYLSFALY
jgi:hypothetical protein